MQRKFRVGIIGTGFGTAVQVPGFQAHPAYEVAAIASMRPGRGQQAAAEHGIPRGYDDWQTMLDQEELDLVSVVTAPDQHHPQTLAALARGRHVLCEKPTAMDMAQARAMLAAAEARGVVHAIDHEFRYQAWRLKVKELLDSGLVGRVVHVNFQHALAPLSKFAARPHGWLFAAEHGGGFLGALGSHMIDSVRWWLGEFDRVAGYLDTVVPERSGRPVTADDSFAFLFTLKSGAKGLVQLVLGEHDPGRRLEILGTAGTIQVLDERVLAARTGEPLQEVPLAPVPEPAGLVWPGKPDPRLAPFVQLADRLAVRLGGGRAELPTFADGVAVQGVLDAVRHSWAGGGWVQVETR